MADPISSVGSALRLRDWIANRTQQVPEIEATPQKSIPDGTQDAMLQAVKQATFEGLHRRGYVNHGMSRAEMIRTFLGIDGRAVLNDADSTVLSSIRDSVRDSLRASGYIDHATPMAEVVQILLGIGSHANQATGLEMTVPIATAIAELCAALIEKYRQAAVQAYGDVTLEVLQ